MAWAGCSGKSAANDDGYGNDDDVEVCDNAQDDDRDGATDCDDPDCAELDACIDVEPMVCEGVMTVADPSTQSGDTTGQADIGAGSCIQPGGSDAVFVFVPKNPDIVEITLTSDADLGLYVRDQCGELGNELACVNEASAPGAVETLVLTDVTINRELYVFVDGATPEDIGSFTLEIRSRSIACGDGIVDAGEECDDGNQAAGDGCGVDCRLEFVSEVEPNDDGTPEPGGGASGNDFDSASANGPYTGDVAISGAITPAGDEDVFEIVNSGEYTTSVRLDTYNLELGVGVACGDSIDTNLHARADNGDELATNDDRDGDQDRCSGLDILLAPGESIYAHVLDFGDNAVVPGYLLNVVFATCGNGTQEGLEQCDDGNNTSGDLCSANCEIEAVCGNGMVEPGEECDDGNTDPDDMCDNSCQIVATCGDGVLDPNEECDDGNTDAGDGCSPLCQFEQPCGDGVVQSGEQCDDGNMTPGDGCDAMCQVEGTAETEPNDDGSPGMSGGIFGDDFSAANADGPVSDNDIMIAALSPAGDEDVFAITNSGMFASSVRFDTYNADVGLGEPCGTTIDTVLNLRDVNGMLLAFQDNRDGPTDRCSGVDFMLQPGATVYAHVVDFGDNTAIGGYFLDVQFATCGDGVLEGLEQCDDGNNAPSDGCDANCAIE